MTKLYRATEEEVHEDRKKYQADYPPFIPRTLSNRELGYIAASFALGIFTQNGPDFDDYSVPDNSRLETYLRRLKPGRLLLLGVGTGRETRLALDMGFDVIGTTLGSRNIEFGHRYLGLDKNNHIEAINEALPFLANTFDYVMGLQVFEHTMMPMMFLLEQSRVLKEGGQLILEWPPGATHHSGPNPHHQVCYTPGQASSLFEKAGLKNIKLEMEGQPIPDSEIWKNDQTVYMLCTGTKSSISEVDTHVRKYWTRPTGL